MSYNFAITGVGGYIAPRHLNAIRAVDGFIQAALDPHDSVGILDNYSRNCQFFTDFERFDRHILKAGDIDYVSVCSPNYLHEAHARSALRAGAHAIVEKPLVINPENLDLLEEAERDSGARRVYPILQMRYHPEILKLKSSLIDSDESHMVEVNYHTPRGPWYLNSWKGDPEKSGGLLMNIGVHLFDLLIWLFGGLGDSHGGYSTQFENDQSANGHLFLETADVNWHLDTDLRMEPFSATNRTFRVDGVDYDFSQYGPELHVQAYKEIIAGRGFTIADARPALELVHKMRGLS